MAENNSSAPLKTSEGAVHPHLIALRTIAAYPVTNLLMNMDAANMQRIAVRALEAQAAPAAVAVSDDFELRERWRAAGGSFHGPCVETGTMPEAQLLPFLRDLAATPALPATEDFSAGDLAEGHPWKDHMTAQLVNQLVSVAKQFHGAQQLRERIAGLIRPLADRVKAEVQAEPVGSDPVAWHSKLYGTCWMHKQPYHLDAGTHFFVRGNPNPVATVLSGAAIQWHTGTAAFEHGTFFYTAPQAQPADALDGAGQES